ncbi:MAG: RNA 3'-terminal phosphate cyclase [Candidatus Thiodiazotropha sp. L084R]
MKTCLNAGVPIGEYLADQLLLPMVLVNGGQFNTLFPSTHFVSNIEVIKQFLDVSIRVEQESKHVWRVNV